MFSLLEFIREITVNNHIPTLTVFTWMFLSPVFIIFPICFIVKMVKHSKTLPKDKTKYLIKSSFYLLSFIFLILGFSFIPDIILYAVHGYIDSFYLYFFISTFVLGLIFLIIAVLYQYYNQKANQVNNSTKFF